jgi:DNA-binding NtrC family response regulator
LTVQVVGGPDEGKQVESSAETVAVGTAAGNALQLTDATVSRYHLELTRRTDRIEVVDLGSTNGTCVGPVYVQRGWVLPGAQVQLGRTTLRVADGGTATLELLADDTLGALRGGTPSMRRLFSKIQRVALSDVSVLLVGESGTGKELIAQALHELGPRASKPFVTVDCGSLSPGLVASELFGHERGAFTGAEKRHLGAFERAHGGTLFLDELGELPAALQANLLGALERRRFRRVGGTEEISIDVRVVSATHRDLRAEVNANRFRLDLYYRLAVVRLDIPPLRERADDIPLLAEQFLREAGSPATLSSVLSREALASLLSHSWPGNVRELRNYVEALVATGELPSLEPQRSGVGPIEELAAPPQSAAQGSLAHLEYSKARKQVLDDFEKKYLAALLQAADGNVSHAARLAKMDRSHLTEMLRRHQLR